MKNLITAILIIFALSSCKVFKDPYQGEAPKKASEWYIYEINEDTDTMYTYFAHEIDPSYIKVQNTWFNAPAKMYKLWDTIGFTTYRHVRTKPK